MCALLSTSYYLAMDGQTSWSSDKEKLKLKYAVMLNTSSWVYINQPVVALRIIS